MYENLMEAMVSRENATATWKAVKRNQGAPGIDGMTTEELRDHIRRHWEAIRAKLLAWTYVPSPVRRKEIAKPDGGARLLGMPTVQDRWIQQMLLQGLQPIFDPTFTELPPEDDPFLAAVAKLAKPRPHWPKDYTRNLDHYLYGVPKSL